MAESEVACSTECLEPEADSRTSELNNLSNEDENDDSSDTGGPFSDPQGLLNGESGDQRKLFECDVCQMKFSNGANMRRHRMRHTGVKPYECRVCQKRFFRKDHLAEHFATHAKTLPYHCPVCNRGFQRQIAMRAHFQNEHVGGQNEAIKSCPLCSYRAASMKSLRVHFFNRHGIDLDRPTPMENGGSDSGDSARSIDNATPPMHFLTPHVEISMTDSRPFSPAHVADNEVEGPDLYNKINGHSSDGEQSPQSGADSNLPTSSSGNGSLLSTRPSGDPGPLTPSVSLIPIKKEVVETVPVNGNIREGGEPKPSDPTPTLTSLIKVPPLKTLLREESPAVQWRSLPRQGGLSLLDCPFCGIGFPDQTLYFLHKGCHSDANPWKCNICGEQCINVYDFNSHLLSKTHQ